MDLVAPNLEVRIVERLERAKRLADLREGKRWNYQCSFPAKRLAWAITLKIARARARAVRGHSARALRVALFLGNNAVHEPIHLPEIAVGQDLPRGDAFFAIAVDDRPSKDLLAANDRRAFEQRRAERGAETIRQDRQPFALPGPTKSRSAATTSRFASSEPRVSRRQLGRP